MKVLVDTNLLLHLTNGETDPRCAVAEDALSVLRKSGCSPVTVPQVAYEYWVAATRPSDVNGLGLRPSEALVELDGLLEHMPLMLDERAIYEHWRELVTKHEVCGKPAHDARLVAAMLRHGVTHLLTFNGGDFKRFEGVTVMTPEAMIRSRDE